MAQHNYSIANQGFPATRQDLNNVLDAIRTNNSGTSAPASQYAGQFWIDTTSSTWTLYIHDGADDIQFATIDTSANTVNFIDSALASDVVINTSGDITTTGAFTSVGIDDNATSTAITIDSSENVGIGLTNPAYKLDIFGNAPSIQLKDDNATNQCTVLATAGDTTANIKVSRSGANQSYAQLSSIGNNSYLELSSLGLTSSFITAEGTQLTFDVNGSERMRIDSSGKVGIGTNTPSQKLDVVGSIEVSDGIYIGGTGTANKLDDYEEGTWTPSLQFGGSSTGITGTFDGKYTKIGARVFFDLQISLTSKGTATGTADISLPFTPSNDFALTGHEAAVTLGVVVNCNTNFFRAGIFNDKIIIHDEDTTPISGQTEGAFTDTSNFRISGCYQTSA